MSEQIVRRGASVEFRAALPWLLGAGLFLLLMLAGGKLLRDPDTYWQIALGQWILAHHAVPHVDTFSATMRGAPWISSQWLAQVLFARAYALAGWAGAVTLTAVAIAIAQGLLSRFLLDRLATVPALTLSMAGLVIAAPHMLARPHALALPFMVAWIAGLLRAREQQRIPGFGLLPVMTAWANLHGGFTFGLFFVAPVALEALLEAAPAERIRVALRWGGFGLAATAAACITPYGPESILVTVRVLGLGPALAAIGEWHAHDFTAFDGFELCLMLGIGFALYRGVTLPPVRILMLLGLLHMALAHERNGELLGFLAPLVLAAPLAKSFAAPAEPSERPLSLTAALALLLATGGASLAATQVVDYRPDPRNAPAHAVAAVKASGKQRILNSYDFGGYLIAEGVAPFIDGRTELYGAAFFIRHDRALNLRDVDSFVRLLRDYDIDVTLLRTGTPAIGLLDRLPGWTRAFADEVAVVHVRSRPAPAR